MRVINNLSLFILVFLLVAACKKDGDGTGPEVEWTHPTQFTTLSSIDTFLVKATISDPDGVRRVSVHLTDPMGNSLASMGDVQPNLSSYELSKSFYLNRPDLPAGVYYLKLEAYDEFHSTSIFREISIHPIPLLLLSTVIAQGEGGSSQIAVYDDGNPAWTSIAVNAGDVIQIESNHQDGWVMAVTGETGKITAFAYPDYSEQWSFEIPGNNSLRDIESADFNEETAELIVGDTDQNMYLLNRFGGMVLGFNTGLIQHQPVHTLLTPSMIYAIERKMDNSEQVFSEFYKVSGALKYRMNLQGEVVKMFEDKSTDNQSVSDLVVIFVNDNGTPKMRIFDHFNPGFSQPASLPQGVMNAVCKIDPRRYLIQIDDFVYHYDFSGSFQIYYSGGPEFEELIYDPVNNQVLGLTDVAIHYFEIQNGGMQELGSIPATDLKTAVLLRNRN